MTKKKNNKTDLNQGELEPRTTLLLDSWSVLIENYLSKTLDDAHLERHASILAKTRNTTPKYKRMLSLAGLTTEKKKEVTQKNKAIRADNKKVIEPIISELKKRLQSMRYFELQRCLERNQETRERINSGDICIMKAPHRRPFLTRAEQGVYHLKPVALPSPIIGMNH